MAHFTLNLSRSRDQLSLLLEQSSPVAQTFSFQSETDLECDFRLCSAKKRALKGILSKRMQHLAKQAVLALTEFKLELCLKFCLSLKSFERFSGS